MSVADPFELIRLRLDEQKSSIEQFLATGGAKDYAEYSRMVGEYSAVQKIRDEIDEIERRYIES